MTLVEVIVLLVIVMLFIAMLLPALGGSRPARYMHSVANLNEAGKFAAAYVATNAGRLPYIGEGAEIPVGQADDGTVRSIRIGSDGAPQWAIEVLWPKLLYDVEEFKCVYANQFRSRDAKSSELPLKAEPAAWGGPNVVSYHYSTRLIWDWVERPNGDTLGVAKFGPQQQSSIAFASRKVMFYDSDRFDMSRRNRKRGHRPVVMVDGSAFIAKDSDAIAPIDVPLPRGAPPWVWPERRIYHDTLEMRDFQ